MTRRFCLTIADEPQALLRVIGLFAQRGLIPDRLTVERGIDALSVAIELAIDAAAAVILLERLRQVVVVTAADCVDAASA